MALIDRKIKIYKKWKRELKKQGNNLLDELCESMNEFNELVRDPKLALTKVEQYTLSNNNHNN